jgi:hypothetical protein
MTNKNNSSRLANAHPYYRNSVSSSVVLPNFGLPQNENIFISQILNEFVKDINPTIFKDNLAKN